VETRIYIKSLQDTDTLASIIAQNLTPGFIIGLTGDLGAGKTTFTKYLAKHMGISANINSPTFTILKIYDHEPLDLYHMDVYRLEQVGYDYELDDYIYGDGVSVIEWYSYINQMLPEEMLSIKINVVDDTMRILDITGKGRYEKVVKDISDRYSN
jgi:tRNA threonylcarbamoyladenosine biosynthesis protein TsaE